MRPIPGGWAERLFAKPIKETSYPKEKIKISL